MDGGLDFLAAGGFDLAVDCGPRRAENGGLDLAKDGGLVETADCEPR